MDRRITSRRSEQPLASNENKVHPTESDKQRVSLRRSWITSEILRFATPLANRRQYTPKARDRLIALLLRNLSILCGHIE